MRSAFDYTLEHGFELLVTIDCDGQHSPQRIPEFVAAAEEADIVSGSRYLKQFAGDTPPPADRRRINEQITDLVNRRLGLHVTDAFCGFKAYRASALARLDITEPGYAMPLQLWVQAAHAKMKIVELPVPLIYLEEPRSFGGSLDDANTRLAYYHQVIDRSLAAWSSRQLRLSSFRPRIACAARLPVVAMRTPRESVPPKPVSFFWGFCRGVLTSR